MKRVLLVDDAAALAELFGAELARRLGCDVRVVVSVADVEEALADNAYDLAIVDLSYPQEDATGIDVLAEIHSKHPRTVLTVATQGDRWVRAILRDAWELLPVRTVLSKSAPLDFQVKMIEQTLAGAEVPVDPAIAVMLPPIRNLARTAESLEFLVPHQGHAKMWSALVEAPEDVTYQYIVERTGLKLNTVKNYRAQLLGQLRAHGLEDPTLREMQQFAWRCRALLRPYLQDVIESRVP